MLILHLDERVNGRLYRCVEPLKLPDVLIIHGADVLQHLLVQLRMVVLVAEVGDLPAVRQAQEDLLVVLRVVVLLDQAVLDQPPDHLRGGALGNPEVSGQGCDVDSLVAADCRDRGDLGIGEQVAGAEVAGLLLHHLYLGVRCETEVRQAQDFIAIACHDLIHRSCEYNIVKQVDY